MFPLILPFAHFVLSLFFSFSNATLAKTISKKREQMYGLLCLIQQVAPGMAIGGVVQKRIDQKFGDKVQRIRRGDDTAFDQLFEFSAPNFITATPPDYTQRINHNQFAKRQQSLPFLNEIKSRRDINKISSSIKFYTTVTIAKLATLLDTSEQLLRERLMYVLVCMCVAHIECTRVCLFVVCLCVVCCIACVACLDVLTLGFFFLRVPCSCLFFVVVAGSSNIKPCTT